MSVQSPGVQVLTEIVKYTYECPVCRSVGSRPALSYTPTDPRLYIECGTCGAGLMITSIRQDITIHYSTPVSDIKDTRR